KSPFVPNVGETLDLGIRFSIGGREENPRIFVATRAFVSRGEEMLEARLSLDTDPNYFAGGNERWRSMRTWLRFVSAVKESGLKHEILYRSEKPPLVETGS